MTAEQIRAALTRTLSPVHLELRDDSALHAGHRPGAPSEGTHWSLMVVSEAFRGLPRLERHRLVHEALFRDAASEPLHALALRALSPEEWGPPAGARSI